MKNLAATSQALRAGANAEQKPCASIRRLGPVSYSVRTIAQLEEDICAWLSGNRARAFSVGYVNPHVFNLAWENPKVSRCLALSDVVAVDGLGVALAAWLINGHFQTRTVMTPLFDRVLENEAFPPARALLIGATDTVVAAGARHINDASKQIHVEMTCDGYQPIEHYLNLIELNRECDVVLVAMGSPRSEELILAASERFESRLFWNIGGGTLHFYAGTQPRVPRVVSRIGMQWFWRILHEPRIAPRYVVGIPLFLWRLTTLLFRSKKRND